MINIIIQRSTLQNPHLKEQPTLCRITMFVLQYSVHYKLFICSSQSVSQSYLLYYKSSTHTIHGKRVEYVYDTYVVTRPYYACSYMLVTYIHTYISVYTYLGGLTLQILRTPKLLDNNSLHFPSPPTGRYVYVLYLCTYICYKISCCP